MTHRPGFELVGVSETNQESIERYFNKFGLKHQILVSDVQSLLGQFKPDVVALFGPTTDHLSAVQAAVAKRVPVMMEKPFAANASEASEIERLSRETGVPVVVNYETTWYPNTPFLFSKDAANIVGPIKKVVVRSGHQGPLEIGVPPEFLRWLVDRNKGGGALLDFGCYGVQLLVKLYSGIKPIAVTAVTQQLKKHSAYVQVEDEATIIIEYPGGQGIVQASWNWPSNRKEWEVHGERGTLYSQDRESYGVKEANGKSWHGSVSALAGSDADPLSYLQSLVGQAPAPSSVTRELSSAALNLEVSRILSAAALSAREGRRIKF